MMWCEYYTNKLPRQTAGFRHRCEVEDLATPFLRGEWSGATSPAAGSPKGGRGNGQQPELRGEGRDGLEPVRRRVNRPA